VRVTRGKRTLSVLTAGDCFGEMSYLAQKEVAKHRSATITTTSDCIVMKIRAEDLRSASLSCAACSTSASSTRSSSASRTPINSFRNVLKAKARGNTRHEHETQKSR